MVSLIVDLISGRQFHLHEAVLQLEGGVGLVGHVLHSIVLLDTNKWFNGIKDKHDVSTGFNAVTPHNSVVHNVQSDALQI